MEKTQDDLTPEEKARWNGYVRQIQEGFDWLCTMYEVCELDNINRYPLPESMDEYSLKLASLLTKEE